MNNKVLNNAKWIILCKVAQSLMQLVVGMLCARYLGPSDYGLINYAKSAISIALPVMLLGLNSTLVQELMETPEQEGEIMGTSIFMEMISSLFCIGMICGFVSVANQGERETLLVCGLYSISLLFQALELIQYWFHSRLRSKYPSIMLVVSYVAVSVYKIYLLVTEKGIYWFALASSVEFGVISLGLLLIYRKMSRQKLSVSMKMARRLIGRSKYYILSFAMVSAVHNIDHIMLKTLIGDAENGFYTAAITSAVVVQFVYYAVMDSFRPVILSYKKHSREKYENALSGLYGLIAYTALAQSAVFAVFAELIISVLYGADFMAAVPVLRILVWYLAFSYVGAVRDIWILAEEKHARLWVINLYGLIANVVMNSFFIPRWGACGAAAASVLSQFFSNVLLGFIMKEIRPSSMLMLRGLHPRFALQSVKKLLTGDME